MRLPGPIAWLWNKWKAVAHVIGKIMSTIMLTIVWAICFGVYAIIIRLRKKSAPTDTYWLKVEKPSDFRFQF